MNLPGMTYKSCKLNLLLAALMVITACNNASSGADEHSAQSSAPEYEYNSDASNTEERTCEYRRDCNKADTGSGTNIIAAHNPGSSEYNRNCLNCHAGVTNTPSLDPAVPSAHIAMLAFTPGKNNERCIWCHRDVSATLIRAAARAGNFQTDIRKSVDTQLCGICHGPQGPGKQFYQAGLTSGDTIDGMELYQQVCSSCHKSIDNSDVRGESAREIIEEIAKNEGGMGALRALDPTWISAISSALGGDPSLPANVPPPGSGALLYWQYCASCHNELSRSNVAGESLDDIKEAINDNEGNLMGLFRFLTESQLQSVAAALNNQTVARND